MERAKISFSIGKRYDTQLLIEGAISVEGYDVTYPYVGEAPSRSFQSMITDLPYDVGEQAFAHYLIARDQGKPLTAIPVFPSRFFPHLGVSVRRDSGIKNPSDLVGRRVGAPDFAYNPAVWMRSILQHQYEVPIQKILWVEDSHQPFFRGLPYPRPKQFQIEQIDVAARGKPYHGWGSVLDDGGVDAIFMASGGMPPSEESTKLFPDWEKEVRAYVQTTGIFPINTVITIQESVVARHPELPGRLMAACQEAKEKYQRQPVMDPAGDHMGLRESVLQSMGLLPNQYGLKQNRSAIRMMIHYCYEQGLIRKLYEPEELFIPGL